MKTFVAILNHLCKDKDFTLNCKVKRSNGKIEGDWIISTKFVDEIKVIDIDGGLVTCTKNNCRKDICIFDFIELNSDKLADSEGNKVKVELSKEGRFECPQILNDDMNGLKWI